MNILVIGGSYFVGKAFVELAAGSHAVTVLNRGNRKAAWEHADVITQLCADRHDPKRLKELFDKEFQSGRGYDVVVDFCAYQAGDIRTLAEILNGRIKQYIFISTCDVYRRGTGEVTDESGAFETRDFGGEAGAYILGKAALERELADCAAEYAFAYTSVRPAFIYGPDNYAPRESMFFNWILQAGQVLYPVDADGSFQMVYVKDVAKSVLLCCGNEETYDQAFNVCGDGVMDYARYVECLEGVVEETRRTLCAHNVPGTEGTPQTQEAHGTADLPQTQEAHGTADFPGPPDRIEKVELTVADVEARQIPLPFPLTKAESEQYSDEKIRRLGMEYTPAGAGMQETFAWFLKEQAQHKQPASAAGGLDIDAILQKVDDLFDENRAKEAERLLLTSLDRAKQTEDGGAQLQLLNELIGYYRQTSEREKLLQVIDDALQTADRLGMSGSIPYATTALNAANGYRSIGELDRSFQCYRVTEEIYRQQMPEDDMRMAGLLNNISLLYQEMSDYETAEQYLLRALAISEKNQAGFEIAVTYANLANTCVLAKRYEKAEDYAYTAIRLFEKRNLYDAHYCAALSALGMCLFEKGESQRAAELFKRGMELVENSLGRNRQYERLKENYERCQAVLGCREEQDQMSQIKTVSGATQEMEAAQETESGIEKQPCDLEYMKMETETGGRMTGLEICRKYYEECAKPALEQAFAPYLDRIAVGLVGEGSDCFGFDDETSRDHDWGSDLCIWVTDETYAEIGEQLQELYEKLPTEFMGYKRTLSPQGAKRRGVMTIGGFYKRLLGAASYEEIDWQTVEDFCLAAAVNGAVFADEEGIFSAFREKLQKGYPERIQYLKLAEDAAKFAQTAEYNYGRMLRRGDRLTADSMLCKGIRHAMRLLHHMNNLYPPHDKWLSLSCRHIVYGRTENGSVTVGTGTIGSDGCVDDTFLQLLGALHGCLKLPDREALAKGETLAGQLGEYLARELYARSLISDVDGYLDMHTEELLMKASVAGDTNEELVDRIVKLEFEAFDKVKNEGGRAYCQNDWPTFSVMRKSQYLTWNRTMLLQYLYDFDREYRRGHNLITEKYARMMESTTPERFQEMAENFPQLTEQQKAIIDQLVAVQMNMMEAFAEEHPKVAGNARNLHTYEDNIVDTSYETYLRGEISTYSDKMLQLYGQHVVQCVANGVNIAKETISNTARLYGYEDLEKFEAGILE